MKYQKGQTGNPLGCPKDRANGGRPPDWLKQKCQTIVDKNKLVEFLGDVASGKNVDFSITIDGRRVNHPANTKNRIDATKELLDRGFGKCAQPIGQEGDVLSKILDQLRDRYKE